MGLEEAIRKAGEGEEEIRTLEMDACEIRMGELILLEKEAKINLERQKKTTIDNQSHKSEVVVLVEEGEEQERGTADLARELDYLNKSIEELEKHRKEHARATLKALRSEINSLEGELQ